MADKQTLRIYIETPSGDRFEAEIPCGTKISQVAADFFEAQGWPTTDRRGRSERAVIDLVDPKNPDNTKRLNSDNDICKSGLRDGDTLRISPVSRAVFSDDAAIWLHDKVKRRHILHNHGGLICQIAWSPNGKMLASASTDGTIRLWNTDTGKPFDMFQTGHRSVITNISWSPNGKMLASASTDETIHLWSIATWQRLFAFAGSQHAITSIAWSHDSKILASGSTDKTICFWNTNTGQLLHILIGHQDAVNCVAWSPNSKMLASGSSDTTIRLWDTDTGQLLHIFAGHLHMVNSIAWSPDGEVLASSAEDNTVRLWNIENKQQYRMLEGFTRIINSIFFSFDGRFLAAKSLDGTIRLWRSDIWEELIIAEENPLFYSKASTGGSDLKSGNKGFSRFPCFAVHPQAPVMATTGEGNTAIYILDLNLDTFLASNITSSVNYANAKVVLLGDTGVGKTGLSLVLTGKPFMATESTHGRHVWVFDNKEVPLDDARTETQEIFLWDLAGQSGYRLFHQLHLSEAVVALVVFDTRSETDPFAGVYYWNRALRQAQRVNASPLPLRKFLVAARMDRGGIGVSRDRIKSLINELGFDGYFETSAIEGQSISELADAIRGAIDWRMILKVTSTLLFRQIKSFLMAEKNDGCLLSPADNLYRAFLKSGTAPIGVADLYEQFEICIRLMASQGLIRRLRLGNCVLLQPELLDNYASALANAMKDEPDGQGIIPEEQVKEAKFFIPTDVRLKDRGQEKFLLALMVEDLLRQEVVLREQLDSKFYLIFPSQSSREYEALSDMSGKTVIFSFEGPVLNVYTTLVVRLSHSGVFKRQEIWKNAVTYITKAGGTYGILLENTGEGKGSLTLFFEDASEEMRFYFEDFVYEHLEQRGQSGTLHRQRIFVCDGCGTVIPNHIVLKRLERNSNSLNCPVCDATVLLLDGESRIKAISSSIVSKMNRDADDNRDRDTTAFVFRAKTNQISIKEIHMTQNGDNTNITAQNISNVGGQQNLGKFENVSANITPYQVELTKALQTLKEVVLASTHLPDDEKQEHIAIITQVSEEATKSKPNKALIRALGSGLLTALKMIPDVTKAVTDVIPLLNNFHI